MADNASSSKDGHVPSDNNSTGGSVEDASSSESAPTVVDPQRLSTPSSSSSGKESLPNPLSAEATAFTPSETSSGIPLLLPGFLCLSITAREMTEDTREDMRAQQPDGHANAARPLVVQVQYKASTDGRAAEATDRDGQFILATPPKQLVKAQSTGQIRSVLPQTPTHQRIVTPRHGYSTGRGRGKYGRLRNASQSDSTSCDPFLPAGSQCEPQHVLLWKIVQGQDVRTTIMLRNLPNEFTYRELKRILDHSSFGKYDFSYLRIDFAESKNVGYGFVNFIDPSCLAEFVSAWGNKKWMPGVKDKFGKERDVRFNYATVQGYDCLVEKFRNSAVMEERPDYRPKIWHTYNTTSDPALVGTEISFPESDNTTKKQRSVDNASHYGLYTVNNRNGRRGRFSQYDRGTSAQLREDAYLNGVSTSPGQVIEQFGTSEGYAYNQPEISPMRSFGPTNPHPVINIAPPNFGYNAMAFPHPSQYGSYVYDSMSSPVFAPYPSANWVAPYEYNMAAPFHGAYDANGRPLPVGPGHENGNNCFVTSSDMVPRETQDHAVASTRSPMDQPNSTANDSYDQTGNDDSADDDADGSHNSGTRSAP